MIGRSLILLIASIGVTLMIQGAIRLFFGVDTRSFFEHEPKGIIQFDMSWIGSSARICFSSYGRSSS